MTWLWKPVVRNESIIFKAAPSASCNFLYSSSFETGSLLACIENSFGILSFQLGCSHIGNKSAILLSLFAFQDLKEFTYWTTRCFWPKTFQLYLLLFNVGHIIKHIAYDSCSLNSKVPFSNFVCQLCRFSWNPSCMKQSNIMFLFTVFFFFWSLNIDDYYTGIVVFEFKILDDGNSVTESWDDEKGKSIVFIVYSIYVIMCLMDKSNIGS